MAMSAQHAIVWLDHHHAIVIDFSFDDRHVVRVDAAEPRKIHRKSGPVGSGKAPDDVKFFDDVVQAIGSTREVMVVGPGTAKVGFVHHVERKHQGLSNRILGVETLDHPSDAELVVFARRYFRRIDALYGPR